jgi:hypothetical protein
MGKKGLEADQRGFLLGTKLEIIATILLPNSVARADMGENSVGR